MEGVGRRAVTRTAAPAITAVAVKSTSSCSGRVHGTLKPPPSAHALHYSTAQQQHLRYSPGANAARLWIRQTARRTVRALQIQRNTIAPSVATRKEYRFTPEAPP